MLSLLVGQGSDNQARPHLSPLLVLILTTHMEWELDCTSVLLFEARLKLSMALECYIDRLLFERVSDYFYK